MAPPMSGGSPLDSVLESVLRLDVRRGLVNALLFKAVEAAAAAAVRPVPAVAGVDLLKEQEEVYLQAATILGERPSPGRLRRELLARGERALSRAVG